MRYVTLGRTGLKVSVAGLGGGGHSRLGLAHGRTEADAVAVVRQALDLGVNLIDTAESYHTEPAVGQAVAAFGRDRVVLSTKVAIEGDADRRVSGIELERRVEQSLTRLRTDRVEIFHLHAVLPGQYDYAMGELAPAMRRLRDRGLIRFLGITEEFGADRGHAMLSRAVRDDCWDVMMVGFNLLNPSARQRVFPMTRAKNIGTLIMFAVRQALSRPERLARNLATLIERGQLDPARLDPHSPLGFLTVPGVAASLTEAAYRFCRHEPGCDVVLFGTGNVRHVEANVEALLGPRLPAAALDQLEALFGRCDAVAGN